MPETIEKPESRRRPGFYRRIWLRRRLERTLAAIEAITPCPVTQAKAIDQAERLAEAFAELYPEE